MADKSKTHDNPEPPDTARAWADLDDEALLDVRLGDLDVELQGTEVMAFVSRLYAEIARRGILFRPHVWISTEWFTPDGIPGIALPFYLAHDRLRRLEKKMMLEVEGGTERDCMQILRHEAGHAISNAFRLHYRKRWREVFGKYSEPYPESYKPKPFSRDYVVHLKRWYAQAHPAEDFAETFAVWLNPNSRWRQRYRGWPALRKLEYVDETMSDLAGRTQPVRSRRTPESLSKVRSTLRQHYHDKRLLYASDWPDFFDRDLRKLFTDEPEAAERDSAASFLRRTRPEIRAAVGDWTGVYEYTIDQVLQDMIDRCKELKLRLTHPPEETKLQLMLMVTVQTMHYLHGGRQRFAV